MPSYASLIRKALPSVVEIARNPCAGSKLRSGGIGNNPGPQGYRWTDFCRVDMGGSLRIVYVWESERVWLIRVGFHLGSGRPGDVYDAVRRRFGLPPDHGHNKEQNVDPCCMLVGSAAPGYTTDETRKRILARL